jgi:hypothetical protein
MTDTITLPREVVKAALEALEDFVYHGESMGWKQVAEALRIALAAEQPKPEPVAWQERHLFPGMGEWTNWYDHQRPRLAHHPLEEVHDRVKYQFRPLYTAPPDIAALLRDAEALRTDAEMMRWLIDNHTAWSWNPSRYNADVIGGFAAFSTGYFGFDLKTAIRKAMQDSALQEDKR